MKVCLIRPPLLVRPHQAGVFELPPLGLAYVAASARAAGHEVTVVDAVGEAPTRDTLSDGCPFVVRGLSLEQILERIPAEPDALAVSCMFSQDWPYLRGLVEALRARFPHAPIVAGGEHITALPEFVLQDSAVERRQMRARHRNGQPGRRTSITAAPRSICSSSRVRRGSPSRRASAT
jgi:hypothetical protein